MIGLKSTKRACNGCNIFPALCIDGSSVAQAARISANTALAPLRMISGMVLLGEVISKKLMLPCVNRMHVASPSSVAL